jgi:hypothetical protein
MKWSEVRSHYPRQWLLVEAIKAHSESGKRIIEDLAVVDTFGNSVAAMKGYQELHREAPGRELLVLHTDRQELDVSERRWLGIRTL